VLSYYIDLAELTAALQVSKQIKIFISYSPVLNRSWTRKKYRRYAQYMHWSFRQTTVFSFDYGARQRSNP